MCSFYNIIISFFKKSYFWWLFPCWTHFQFYQRHLLLNIFKALMTCLKWLGRWYLLIQAGCKQLSPCLSGASRPATNVYRLTARWSPITLCIIHYNMYTKFVLYTSLLAVGRVTHDMCACIVRQDYTGAHFHALGWTSPQRLFILHHLRREIY